MSYDIFHTYFIYFHRAWSSYVWKFHAELLKRSVGRGWRWRNRRARNFREAPTCRGDDISPSVQISHYLPGTCAHSTASHSIRLHVNFLFISRPGQVGSCRPGGRGPTGRTDHPGIAKVVQARRCDRQRINGPFEGRLGVCRVELKRSAPRPKLSKKSDRNAVLT